MRWGVGPVGWGVGELEGGRSIQMFHGRAPTRGMGAGLGGVDREAGNVVDGTKRGAARTSTASEATKAV